MHCISKALVILFTFLIYTCNAQCVIKDSLLYEQVKSLESDSAIEKLGEKLIDQNKDCWYGYNIIGYHLYLDKDYTTAHHYLSQAFLLNPHSPKIILNYTNNLDRINQSDSALKILSFAIENLKEDERFYSNRGLMYLDRDEYELTLKDFLKAMEINPEPYTLNNLTRLYIDYGMDTEAEKYIEMTLNIDPKNEEALLFKSLLGKTK